MQRQNRNMNTPFQQHRSELQKKIKYMYMYSATIPEIEERLNCSRSTINRALKGLRNRRGQNND